MCSKDIIYSFKDKQQAKNAFIRKFGEHFTNSDGREVEKNELKTGSKEIK